MPALALALSYPLLAHAAVHLRSAPLAALSLAVLLALALYPGLRAGRPAAWLVLAAGGVLAVLLARTGLAVLPLYLPPVLVPAFMAWLFGHTLLPGHRPLIERLVATLHGTEALDPAIRAYARRITALWAFVLGALAALNLALALLAEPGGLLASAGLRPPWPVPQRAWSLFANFGTYAVIGLLFVGEYAWRRYRFPDQPYRNLGHFIARVAGLPRTFWRGLVR